MGKLRRPFFPFPLFHRDGSRKTARENRFQHLAVEKALAVPNAFSSAKWLWFLPAIKYKGERYVNHYYQTAVPELPSL